MNVVKNIGKFATSATVALFLAEFDAYPVYADHLNFTLYNQSGRAITHLYISRVDSGVWGSDVLGRDILPSGQSTYISFPGQNPNSPCFWDIMVVYAGGGRAADSFNLCNLSNDTIVVY